MIYFLGDFFAIGLVIILFMFFFDSKISVRYMPLSSQLFLACLGATAITALTDLGTGYLLLRPDVPVGLNMLANTFYYFICIFPFFN